MRTAIETFVRGVAFTRSFTHPYQVECVEDLWVMRDALRKSGKYRSEDWVAQGVPAEKMNDTIRRHTRGRYAVCAIHHIDESDEPLRTGFRALDYRLGTTEPVMLHDLKRIPTFETSTDIHRVMDQGLADQVNKAARARQILPEHLSENAPLRQYVAQLDNKLVGWVRSIAVGNATWCSNMYVRPEYRRKGIGRALMEKMLRDDRAHGAKQAVLTASHTGALLYPILGYRQIGTLLLYTPKRR